ncbi:MAG TPA: hypothetical protein VN428_04720 [Bryobacteraceae bacterium]|nr:hypothetical protein [Bryobacteraceae bacterium]
MDERTQFRSLRRAFLRRFLEHEFLSAGGDLRDLLSNVLAILGAFGVCVGFLLFQKHYFRILKLPAEMRAAVSWSDQEFLMSMTIAIAGIFVIICWDALFPDRTDCMVLSAAPVRPRTVLAAKLAAVFMVFAFLVAAANAVPMLVFPPLMIASGTGHNPALWFVAQLVATVAAALFVFAAATAVQGVLINLLPYRAFRRVSAACQLGAVFLLLIMFFATPDVATPDRLSAPENRLAIALLPAFWYLGLYQAIMGSTLPVVGWLARMAVGGLGLAVAIAALGYWAGYARYVRRTIEDAGSSASRVRSGRGLLWRLTDWIVVREPGERAVFHFMWRTLTRSRTHRLIFAGYMSLGLTYLAMGNIGLMEGRGAEAFLRPDAATGGVPIVLSFFALAGMRNVFSLPVELRANWLFKVTEKATPREALRAVYKLMLMAGVLPAVAFSLPVYSLLWGPATGIRFTVLVLLVELIVMEKLMRDYRKIPFACSYLPGKSNLKLTFGMYVVVFMMAAWTVTNMAVGMAGRTRGFVWGVGLSLAWLGWRAWRRRVERGWPGFQYEDKAEWQPVTLELT